MVFPLNGDNLDIRCSAIDFVNSAIILSGIFSLLNLNKMAHHSQYESYENDVYIDISDTQRLLTKRYRKSMFVCSWQHYVNNVY